MSDKKIIELPVLNEAKRDKLRERENLARQMRTGQMMREQARDNINAIEQISDIIEIEKQLQGERDSAGNLIPMDRDVRQMLTARADIKFKLLDKVLPNLKATESVSLNMHEHGGTIGVKKVSDVELVQRLQLWRKNHGQGHIMRAEAQPDDGESCVEATFTEVKVGDESSDKTAPLFTEEFDFL